MLWYIREICLQQAMKAVEPEPRNGVQDDAMFKLSNSGYEYSLPPGFMVGKSSFLLAFLGRTESQMVVCLRAWNTIEASRSASIQTSVKLCAVTQARPGLPELQVFFFQMCSTWTDKTGEP